MRPFVVLAALCAAYLFAAPAQAAPEKIAVVRMMELMEKHPRATGLQQKFEKAQKDAEGHAKGELTALRALQQDIELMPRTSPMRAAKLKEFRTRETLLKFESQWRKEEAIEDYKKGLENLYAEIQRTVARYARERGILLVLLKNDALLKDTSETQGMAPGEYMTWVQMRGVVFCEPTLDITDYIKATFMPRAPQPGNPPPVRRSGGAPPSTPGRGR